MPTSASTRTIRLTVIAADGLIKKDLFFKMPDPFGIIIMIAYGIELKLLIFVYCSCCHRRWRANTHNNSNEKDT